MTKSQFILFTSLSAIFVSEPFLKATAEEPDTLKLVKEIKPEPSPLTPAENRIVKSIFESTEHPFTAFAYAGVTQKQIETALNRKLTVEEANKFKTQQERAEKHLIAETEIILMPDGKHLKNLQTSGGGTNVVKSAAAETTRSDSIKNKKEVPKNQFGEGQ